MNNLIKTEYVDPATLKFAEYNPRFISDNAMEGLKASIKEFGIVDPFIVNKRNNTIVGGHMRCRAAIEMGIKQVPIVFVDLPLEKEKALNLTLNNQNITGDFTAGLELVLSDIKADIPDLYDTLGLDSLLADIPEIPELPTPPGDPDKVPEVAPDPVIKTGDLVTLGKHRLLCGDSTKKEDVNRVMGGEKVENVFVFADAPYGINIVNEKGKVGADKLAKNKTYSKVTGDDSTETACKFYMVCKEIGIEKFILWGGNYFINFLPFSPNWLIWDKRLEMNSNNFADGEMAWTNIKTPVRIFKYLWNGMIREGKREDKMHPNQKPVEMLSKIIESFIPDNNIVFDGFLGSGSTLLACHNTKRTCYAMEMECCYVEMSMIRYAEYCDSWDDVVIERDGKKYTYNDLKNA